MAIATGQITLVDLTDSINLQGFLTSSQSKMQFADFNGSNHNPNWALNNVKITAELNEIGKSGNLIEDPMVKGISWFYKLGSGVRTPILESNSGFVLEENPSKSATLTINQNKMNKSNPTMLIECEIRYQYNASFPVQTYKLDISYSLAIQGQGGSTGATGLTALLTNESATIVCDAKGNPQGNWQKNTESEVMVYQGATRLTPVATGVVPSRNQFKIVLGSPVGCSGELVGQNSGTYNKFKLSRVSETVGSLPVNITICDSNGATQTITKTFTFTKSIAGADGTSVRILGKYDSLHDLQQSHPSDNEIGDGYLVQGTLYVWTGEAFEDMGNIQGPQGEQGQDGATGPQGPVGKTINLTGTSNVFILNDKRTTASPASITLTAELLYLASSTCTWTYGVDGAAPIQPLVGSGKTQTITWNGNFNKSWKTMTVKVACDGVYDTFTIAAVSNGHSPLLPDVTTPDGYIFRNEDKESLRCVMTLYKEGSPLSGGVTYQWYKADSGSRDDSSIVGVGWKKITDDPGKVTGAKTNTLTVFADTVLNIENFKCRATYETGNYFGMATLMDLTDPVLTEMYCPKGTTFKNGMGSTEITCKLYRNGAEIDSRGSDYEYKWVLYEKDGSLSGTSFGDTKTITVTAAQIKETGTVRCVVSEKTRRAYVWK